MQLCGSAVLQFKQNITTAQQHNFKTA